MQKAIKITFIGYIFFVGAESLVVLVNKIKVLQVESFRLCVLKGKSY